MTECSATRERPFHGLLVFCSTRAVGNPTGVVLTEDPLPPEVALATAQNLGFPDTAFVSADPSRDADVLCDTYSPAEPLAFCVQTLLATAAVRHDQGVADSANGVRIRVGSRVARVTRRERPGAPDLYWADVASGAAEPFPLDGVRRLLPPASEGLVVDSGRRRLFLRIEDPGAFDTTEPSPAAVLRFCRDAGLSGLCLHRQTGPDSLALRVFTTSLDGREDAATGGAVAGLDACLGARRLDAPTWRVEQGSGPRHRRGTLFLRRRGDLTSVGGEVRQIARGFACVDH